LINGPSILLADEPTGNLDTRTSHEIMEMLTSLNRDQGVTMVVVTHEPDIAAYASRIITMVDGRIASDELAKVEVSPVQAVPGNAPLLKSYSGGAVSPQSKTGPVLGFVTMILGAAAQALWRNKMRSALTMLGVFIGVAALIAMVAVGQGANAAVRKQIESLGTNLLVVLPGATTTSGVRSGAGSASTLNDNDAVAIRREDPAVGMVSYLIRQPGQIAYNSRNWTTNIQGVSASYLDTANWHIATGRSLTDDDDNMVAMVALIGQTVYRQLFAIDENPVGAMILIKGTPVRVVGLLSGKGQTAFGTDQDDVLLIPFATAERKVLGAALPTYALSATDKYFPPPTNPYGITPRLVGKVNQIYVQAVAPDQIQTAIAQVTATLSRRHHIQPGSIADFDIKNLSQVAEAAEGSSRIMAALLAAVASISLLVGGIGIMNTLLVSVTERTREIGLRMAIGARRMQVLLQFLGEAVFLSVTGGMAGIGFGLVASESIQHFTKWPTLLSPLAVVGGFAFSAAVGIFFGFYPARKASHLDPIEALRYE
jgi:macrolide transport system ATP-binding/permease protein